MKRGAVLLGIGLLATWGATPPANARPFTLEDVVAFRTIDDLRVSPDGKAVVFAVTGARLEEGRYETDLHLVTLEDGGPARRLTSADADDEMPRWSPDGGRIAFLSGRGGSKQVWVLRRDGGEAERVTDHPQPIASFDWAPDGRRMLVVAPSPEGDDEAQLKTNKDDAIVVGRDWRNHRLWLAGAEAGRRPAALQPLTDGATHIQKALWSPDGTRIAFLESPTPEADADEEAHLRILEVAGGALLDVPDSLRASGEFAWSPDGRRLAFAAPFDGRGISRQDLFVYEAPEGRGAAAPGGAKPGTAAPVTRVRNLSAALDRDIEAIRWTPDGGAVDVLYGRGVVHAVARLDGRAPARDVWTPGQVVELLQRARTGWVYVRGDRPPEIWVAPERGEGRALTAVNQATASIDLPETEAYRWKGPGGALEAVLVKPRGAAGKKPLPLVLRPHGGPRLHVDLSFDPSALYLAARGFLVLRPNFRGSTGYGDAFTRGNVGNWGDGPFADVMSGADALIRQGLADPEHLFLYGWSYGGYLANWAATHTGRLRAIASGAGVADLRMQYVLSDARRWRFDYFTGSPFEGHLAIYNRLSPITYAENARVPTLFLHGENDVRCPPAQGVMMHRALADRGVPTELVLYPREGHDFQEPRHILDRIRRVADWFEKHDRPAGKSR